MKEWIGNREVIHLKTIGLDHMYVVVRNDFSEREKLQAQAAGVTISPVSSSDVCVYLTSKTKGGIDDVFI